MPKQARGDNGKSQPETLASRKAGTLGSHKAAISRNKPTLQQGATTATLGSCEAERMKDWQIGRLRDREAEELRD